MAGGKGKKNSQEKGGHISDKKDLASSGKLTRSLLLREEQDRTFPAGVGWCALLYEMSSPSTTGGKES